MLKKITSKVGVFAICLASLTACGDTSSSSSTDKSSSGVTTTTTTTTATAQADSSEVANDSSSQSDSKEEKFAPAMWTVADDDGNQVTLVGSMHALKDEDYPLPDSMMELYNSADVVAFECDTTAYTADMDAQYALLNEMTYEDDTVLENVLSQEAYSAVAGYMESYGVNIEIYKNYKPWAISSLLDSLLILSTSLDTTKGLDTYFLETAHEDGKEIYEVETVNSQLDLLKNMSDEVYNFMFLSYEGETKDSQAEQLEELYDAWRTGDLDKIWELTLDEDAVKELTDEEKKVYDEYADSMIYDRNVVMADAVKALMKEDKNVFYMVGSAHYAGEKGIIALLENDGYSVERIEY